MKNNFRKYKFWLVAAFCVAGVYLYLAQPFKITDPTHPRFNPEKFKFEDYSHYKTLYSALEKNLPKILSIGMTEEEVDNILVKSGRAKKRFLAQPTNENKYEYCYTPWQAYVHSIYYAWDKLAAAVYIVYEDKKVKSYGIRSVSASGCTGEN